MLRLLSSWPLPALLSWLAAWIVYKVLWHLGVPAGICLLLACALSVLLALGGQTRWRRIFIAAGFPASLIAAGALTGWASLVWLVPLLALLLLYPLASWRDAPLFPTPDGALHGMAELAVLAPGARIVDAGCGLGAGLKELEAVYPDACISGMEWSWPLTLACRVRCRFAKVLRADIWRADWSNYDMVYLFQRPESMARAVAKARAELHDGAWLVSLEFEAADLQAQARLESVEGKPVWLYRAPFVASAGKLAELAPAASRRAAVASMNPLTSSSTGAIQRRGQEKAATKVTWLARG